MDKIVEWTVIKYLRRHVLAPKDMETSIEKNDHAYAKMKRWVADFQRGHSKLSERTVHESNG